MASIAEEESFSPPMPGSPTKSMHEESNYSLVSEEPSGSASQTDMRVDAAGHDNLGDTGPVKSPVSPEYSRRSWQSSTVRLYTQFGTRGGAFSTARPKSDVDIRIKVGCSFFAETFATKRLL